MSKHVFLSYVHEDKDRVDELQSSLEAAGFEVWRDKDRLFPGDNWELKIRQAIQGGTFVFLACFSSALSARETSYQNEELALAASEYRLRPMDTSWLMTVRLDECEIPPVDLGMGRTLDRTIQRTDLFGDQKQDQLVRLVVSIGRVMDSSPGTPSPVVLEAVATSQRADNVEIETLRSLLRNPMLVMDFDEFMGDLRRPALAALGDRDRFPMSGAGGQIDTAVAKAWIERVREYEAVVSNLIEPLKLIGAYGQAGQERELTQTMRALGQEGTQSTGLDLYRDVHAYPALVLTYVCGIAAETKKNYGTFRAATADVVVNLLNNSGNWPWLGSLLCKADENTTIDDDLIQAQMQGRVTGRYAPISDHIYTLLAPVFVEQFVSDEDYAEAFDRVEVLFDAIGADARVMDPNFYGGRTGYGRYTWRYRYVTPIEQRMLEDAQSAGNGWTPLLGGLFGGDSVRAIAALTEVADNAAHFRRNRY